MKILLPYLRFGVALIALYCLGQNLLMAQSFVAHDLFLPIGYERVAYIDADEYADLVQIQYGALVWRANDGAGNFGDPQPLLLPNDYAMRTLDIDQDGDRDALFLNLNIWYENDGTQNYTPHPIAPAFVAPNKVYVRDADGDTDIDFVEIVSTGWQSYAVHWYINDGNGNFTIQYNDVDAPTLSDHNSYPFLMNSNTDGFLDIVFWGYVSFNPDGTDTLATKTLFNDGTGNFGNVQQKLIMIHDSLGNCIYGADLENCATIYSTWVSTGVGDLDGDGDDELGVNVQFSTFEDHSSFNAFYRNNESNEVWEMELAGQPFICYPQEGEMCDYEPYPLFSYDINRDGRQDLMGYFGLRLQQPDGSLSEPVFHCGSPENERQIFKMDSIHFDDVAKILPALELSDKWVANDSICTEHYLQDPNSLKIFGQMQLADTDNDSDMDIIFNATGIVTLLINQGDTAYSRKQVHYYPAVSSNFPTYSQGTKWMKIIDVDNDGLLDLVADIYYGSPSYSGNIVYWHRNLGDNNFSTQLNISNLFDAFLADIDTDGDIDVLSRRITSSEASNYVVQLQVSPGVFEPSPLIYSLPLVGSSQLFIAKTSDIDQDGDQDLWLRDYSPHTWAISLQNGDFVFDTPIIVAEGTAHGEISDVDNDGDDDLVYKNDNHISMQLNNAGTFSLVELINEVSSAHYPQMINLNADALPDLVINSDTAAYAPFVLFNSSTGFGSAQPFPSDVVQIQHFDQLDNDWSNDIFYTDATGRLWLRQNDGQGGFEAYAPIYIADNAAIHDVGDMNSDGKNDVLCRNYLLFDPDGVTYFLNQNIVVGTATPDMTNAAINLYPNPVSHTLYIDQKQNLAAQATQLQISNILGQIVYQAQLAPNTQTQVLTLPPLSNGLYFAALYDQSDKLVHRQKISKH